LCQKSMLDSMLDSCASTWNRDTHHQKGITMTITGCCQLTGMPTDEPSAWQIDMAQLNTHPGTATPKST
jgi:hypothetical protein